jgi:hypothetical protein
MLQSRSRVSTGAEIRKRPNSVSASRLQQIANALKVTPEFFFEGGSTKGVGGSKGSGRD